MLFPPRWRDGDVRDSYKLDVLERPRVCSLSVVWVKILRTKNLRPQPSSLGLDAEGVRIAHPVAHPEDEHAKETCQADLLCASLVLTGNQ